MVGQNIGKYRVLDRVGRGGMGTVYRAIDETLHRDVAIKVLNAELNDPEVARRFRAEAITVARLSHPGIATIYELFQHDGQWLMVMEFVQGETLERMIERGGPQAPEQAAELCMQSLAALAHAHSMGVVHRDLKPANIMLTEGGTIKIMDFGIARVAGTEHLTNAGFMMGTPAYMAPEQVLGQEIDARADLYAIGVVFYRLLTAQLPFKGETPFAMAQAQVNNPPTPVGTFRHDLPPWVEEVMSRSLAKKPVDRFQSAAEFHEGLARSLTGQPMALDYSSSAPTGLIMTPPRAMPTGSIDRTVLSSTPLPPVATGTGLDTRHAPPGVAPHDLGPTMAVATPLATERPATSVSTPAPAFDPTPSLGTVMAPAPVTAAGSPSAVPQPLLSPPAHVPGAASSAATAPDARKNHSGLIAAAAVALLAVAAIAAYLTRGSSTPATPEAAQLAANNTPAATPPPVVETPAPPPATPAPVSGAGPVAATTGTAAAAADAPAETDAALTDSTAAAGRGAAGRSNTPAAVPVLPNEDFDNVKVMIVDGRKAKDEDVRLSFVANQLTIVGKRAGNAIANVPYRNVENMTYTKARDPKWNSAFNAPPDDLDVGGILRTSKHWLILQTRESYVLFRLEDSNWARVIAAIEARTGHAVQRPAGDRD